MVWAESAITAEVPRKRLGDVRGFIDALYGYDLHAQRVGALAGLTLDVMTVALLAVAIGQVLAQARGPVTKHSVNLV